MKYLSILLLLIMIAVVVPLPTTSATEMKHAVVDSELRSRLSPVVDIDQNMGTGMLNASLVPVARFYRQVGFQPVWNGPEGLLPQGEILLQLMSHVSDAGLFAADYRPSYFETTRPFGVASSAAAQLATLAPHIQLDVLLTDGVLRYAQHIHQGRIAPETLSRIWPAWRRTETRDVPIELAQAVKENRLHAYIESLHPGGRAYQELQKALGHYTRIAQTGGWPAIAPGPTLRRGDTGPRVGALQRRLAITGDLSVDTPGMPVVYDGIVESAVKRFQRRHGLRDDGLVGRRTLAELNVPVAQRITRLILNMERRRWLPDDLGQRHLIVNIPAFELRLVETGVTVAHMRTVVGKKRRQTPIMSAWMTYLEFNPYWNIPQKIARKDILPKAISDPEYLTSQGIRVFDSWDSQAQELDPTHIAWENLSGRYFPYRLRQDPSDLNALGQVKFMFPNPHSIYIHDTPGKALFNRQGRSYSSGCVRVETPMMLAHYLLQVQGWDQARLEAAISAGHRKTVLLDNPIPVHLVYFTAWVDEEGQVNFREDIYGRDQQLIIALSRGESDPTTFDNTAEKDALIVDRALSPGFISRADTPSPKPAGEAPGKPMAGI